MADTTRVPCPFVRDDITRCPGHIVSFAAEKADLSWTQDEAGAWRLHMGRPRSRFRLFCSERGDHASYSGPGPSRWHWSWSSCRRGCGR